MNKAPWTKEIVDKLQRYQDCDHTHEWTCGEDRCRAALIPTTDGWVCPVCEYTQDWYSDVLIMMIEAFERNGLA